MPVYLTPGVRFLAQSLLRVALPACIIGIIFRTLPRLDMFPQTWVLAAVSLVAIPVVFAMSIAWSEMSLRRRAAAMGARVAPRAEGKWIGNVDILRMMMRNWERGYPGDGLPEAMAAKGPAIDMHVLWESLIITTSPEHIQLILATDFNNYVKGSRFQSAMGSVLGTGVFNSDGDMWKFHRAMTRPFFTKDRISHFELFDRHADEAITQMKFRLREGCALDVQDLMSRFTLDTATSTLFGSCVHSLSSGLPYPHTHASPALYATPGRTSGAAAANDFARAFLAAQEHIANRERMGWIWPLFEIWQDKTREPMRVVDAYLGPIVRGALERKKDDKEHRMEEVEEKMDDGDDETLLDHLVNLTDDETVLKDEILNIMIAGRDTTAATLTFIVYFLAMYPSVASRLREEVLAKVGATRRPGYDDVKEMKYLRAVINETLRLYPVVPFNIRESINETTWPSPNPTEKPIYIPAHTKVPYSVFLMHRRKDLWGPDAEEFDPDRFLDERLKKYLTPKPFIFLPFNAGPRICLGQQFAYNEMSFMLIRLLQNFSSFSLDTASCPPEFRPPAEWKTEGGRKGVDQFFPKVGLTMYSAGGLWIRAVEAVEVETN